MATISLPDAINGAFELVGSLLIWLSVRKLHHDRMVRGVHWAPIMFFSAWGMWNLYYYKHLQQWVSWAGGMSMVLANAVWVIQILYYLRKEKRNDEEFNPLK